MPGYVVGDPLAYTEESRIYFKKGEYDPHSVRGLADIGHEITHKAQYDSLGSATFQKRYLQEYFELRQLGFDHVALVALTVLLSICEDAASAAAPTQDPPPCPVTKPNGSTPPGERPGSNHHGNGSLWTVLQPDGTVVFRPGGPGFVLEDGSLSMKFPWGRGVKLKLRIEGRRLDGSAPPLRARIPIGYADTGFQATALIFPAVGCWEVTGRTGDASLTFVVRVVRLKDKK